MKRVIVKGETIQEALNKGIKQLKTEKDKVKYTVLEEPKSGFLGFFGKKEIGRAHV